MNKGNGPSAITAYLQLYGREDSHITPSYEIVSRPRQFSFGDDSTSHLSTAPFQQRQTSQVLSVNA
jgi:hypothetical protein